MDALLKTINNTPIIDHHAHNLLLDSDLEAHDLTAITSEATGPALKHSSSTLSHLRAVKQLSEILECEQTWEAVKNAIESKRREPGDAWARTCFYGIETALIDDGLDLSSVHPYEWHDRLTRSTCRRIVRIERVAENAIVDIFESTGRKPSEERINVHEQIISRFTTEIEKAISDPKVAGFKSVICYRVGLAIPAFDNDAGHLLVRMLDGKNMNKLSRLEDERLSPYFVHLTAKLLERSEHKKPLQFHTGLGDNDIHLGLSNPSHLQNFIKAYPKVPIVLLHASYPFTKEAGYLASVYENCWLDLGEVFPMVSQNGQERVIQEALELCPSEKLTWSTDGHWFPETYLLATLQAREAMRHVLCDMVQRGSVTAMEAASILRDIFFNTANTLYNLELPLIPLQPEESLDSLGKKASRVSWTDNFGLLKRFLRAEPSIEFLRLQWLDYTSTLRLRILPIKQAIKMFDQGKFVGITKAVLGLLQHDITSHGFSTTGEFLLYPRFDGVRKGSRPGYATVQCEFQKENGDELRSCPRTVLRRQVENADTHGLNFLVGFEIEIVFMRREVVEGEFQYGCTPINEGGHAWSSARPLQRDDLMELLGTIYNNLERAGIEILQFHPESAPGQFEFVLSPLPPLLAVDTLIAARDIIYSAAANADMRATLYPKPFAQSCGTGAHLHLSMTPVAHWEAFYAGVLKHMRAIAAFAYSNDASYERVSDGVWAGSTWIAWGTQNREVPLRRIEGSHFEIKCVDGLSNPYLVLAAILGAGLQGVLDKETLQMKDCREDPSTMSAEGRKDLGIIQQFPKSIGEALQYLDEDEQVRRTLGQPAVDTYLVVKRTESEFLRRMDPEKRRNWIIERY